ncbi:MAG: transporter substrate-binding domain-containing protein, partial [Proteobacteria bacterium]|nr:transporter substrate-binding domain-containing protein [Pseudomonadota bacterium]
MAQPTSRPLMSASEYDYPPFALVKPDGSADGFSVDLLRAVVEETGMEIEFAVGPWHEIKQELTDGKIDVLPLVSYSDERAKYFDFSASYLRMHGTIFVREGNKEIKDEKDLKGKKVAVMRGDTAHEYAIESNLTDELVLTRSYDEALRLLSKGKCDAVLIQQIVGWQLLKKMGITNLVDVMDFDSTSLKPQGKPLLGFEQKFCFAVHQGDSKLLSKLNEGLAIVIADGTYASLYDKWFGPILPSPSPSAKEVLRVALFIIIPIVILICIIALFLMKREVRNKTAILRNEIFERTQAQLELNDEKDRYTSLFEAVMGPLLVADADTGIIVECNHVAEAFFGRSRSGLVGLHQSELHVDAQGLPERRALTQDFKKAKVLPGKVEEVFLRCADDNVLLVAIKAKTFRYHGQTLQLGIFRDITEAWEAEQALRKSKDLYQTLLQGLPDIIMRFDREGRHLFASDKVEQLAGISAEQFIGKTHRELGFPEEQCDFWEASIRQVFEMGRPVISEFTFEGLVGTIVFDWRLLPETDKQGAVLSVLSISRDVTEHRRLQHDYQILFDKMLDGFALHEIIFDAAGKPVDYRFLTINPAFEQLTGISTEAVVGKTVLEVLPNTEPYWIETYGQVALTGTPTVFEQYSNELEKHFIVTAFLAAPNQFACIFHDITSLKKAEEELM